MPNEGLPLQNEVTSERHHYIPCPQQLDQVIPDHVFFHLFFSQIGDHLLYKWMGRSPKKLKDNLLVSIPESDSCIMGWGIHIDEGPDVGFIFVVSLFGIIVSGSLLWYERL